MTAPFLPPAPMRPATRTMIPVDAIDDSNRLRPVDPAWAQALAASMAEGEQEQPILVRPAPAGSAHEFMLVIGGHRLAGARINGWAEIWAEVRAMSDAQARLAEIDENLVRQELTALDRAIFLAERKRVWETLHPETQHGKAKKPKNQGDGKVANIATFSVERFTAAAAKKTGLSERTVQAAIALVERLSPDAIALLRNSPLADNAAQLARLADLPPDEQLACAGVLAKGEAGNVDGARVAAKLAAPREQDPQEALFERFLGLWGRASAKTRKRIIKHVNAKGEGSEA